MWSQYYRSCSAWLRVGPVGTCPALHGSELESPPSLGHGHRLLLVASCAGVMFETLKEVMAMFGSCPAGRCGWQAASPAFSCMGGWPGGAASSAAFQIMEEGADLANQGSVAPPEH